MIVDFSEVRVQERVEGEARVMDLREVVGNTVWRDTSDIAVSDMGRDIYHSGGETEIPDRMAPEIARIISRSDFITPIKRAVGGLLAPKGKGGKEDGEDVNGREGV